MSSTKLAFVLKAVIVLIVANGILIPETHYAHAETATPEYTLTAGEFFLIGADPWTITGGCMSWQLFDILPHGSSEVAVYEVKEFSLEVADPSGAVHTLSVVPDGLPSPFFGTGIPDFEPDSGLVNVYAGGFLDMLIYDISIDGALVDQTDNIGGPAFVGTSWTGSFPEPTSFFASMLAYLPALEPDISEVILTAELAPCTTSVISVVIDIKPGSDPNSIACRNGGVVIAVAILTTEDFDATNIDHTTVTFQGAREIHADRRSGEPRRHEADVDGDGDVDLVFHFSLIETDLTCDSTEATLTGETVNGLVIEGTDEIRMVDGGNE
jgi:hypothetical protein